MSGAAVASDGRSVYTTGVDAYFSAFRRDPASGALEQFGCLEVAPSYRSCAGVASSVTQCRSNAFRTSRTTLAWSTLPATETTMSDGL